MLTQTQKIMNCDPQIREFPHKFRNSKVEGNERPGGSVGRTTIKLYTCIVRGDECCVRRNSQLSRLGV